MPSTTTAEQGRAFAPSPVLEQAARLVVLGVNVIPIGADKRPLGPWKRWQTERQVKIPPGDDDAFLLEHFERRGTNLGAVTGAISSIVVADADSRGAWDALVRACGGALPPTVIANTAKGRHVWFAHPGGEIRNSVRLAGVPLDVRGDGGYVVCPPSIHPSGVPYTWGRSPLEHWPPASLPEGLLDLLRPPDTPRGVSSALFPRGNNHTGFTRENHTGLASANHARYAEAALAAEADAVRSSSVGERNDTLNRAAFALSRFVLSGELRADDVWHALAYAARAAGLSEAEACRTISSAFGARAG